MDKRLRTNDGGRGGGSKLRCMTPTISQRTTGPVPAGAKHVAVVCKLEVVLRSGPIAGENISRASLGLEEVSHRASRGL